MAHIVGPIDLQQVQLDLQIGVLGEEMTFDHVKVPRGKVDLDGSAKLPQNLSRAWRNVKSAPGR